MQNRVLYPFHGQKSNAPYQKKDNHRRAQIHHVKGIKRQADGYDSADTRGPISYPFFVGHRSGPVTSKRAWIIGHDGERSNTKCTPTIEPLWNRQFGDRAPIQKGTKSTGNSPICL
jgi:hypothetical protein